MKTAWNMLIVSGAFALTLLLSGCASGDGGQALSGILQGIGQGLSGL